MANSYFKFKQFKIEQDRCGMKVTTDGCTFGSIIPIADQMRVLDIGTGTGLLSLMLAQKAKVEIDAVEVDEDAFLQATSNFKESPWRNQIHTHQLAIQDFSSNHKYDLIVSNPPFFKNSQKGNKTGKNKAVHALELSMRDLISCIKKHLIVSGEAWIMYPEYEMNEFISLAKSQDLYPFSKIILRNKSEGPVFRIIVGIKQDSCPPLYPQDIYIKESNGNYSDTFNSLLKDYYLHL